MNATSTASDGGALRIRDIPAVLFSPRKALARVEDVAGYGWPLVVLLALVTALGCATVQTGLIDREVERGVQEKLARLEKEQFDVVERSQLSRMIEETRKQGDFERLVMRAAAVVAAPLGTLATVLLIPALFYGLVALGGRKPEWNSLVTVGVFASFADVLGGLTRLLLQLRFHTLNVDTSMGVLARLNEPALEAGGSVAAVGGLLSAIDPFRIWFWVLMAVGLSVTAQLRGWRAWGSCAVFWIIAAGVRTLMAVGAAGGPPSS